MSRKQTLLCLALVVALPGGGLVRAQKPAEEAPPRDLPLITSENAQEVRLAGQLTPGRTAQMAWSPQGAYLALRSTGGVVVYGVSAEKGVKLSKARTLSEDRPPLAFCFGRDEGVIFVCDGLSGLKGYDIRSGWVRDEVKDTGSPVLNIAQSASGVFCAVTADGKLRVWRDGSLDQPPKLLEGNRFSTQGVSYDPKGMYGATWGWGDEINVWNLAEGAIDRTFKVEFNIGPPRDPWAYSTRRYYPVETGAAFGTDGKTLWFESFRGVQRWSVESGDELLPAFPRNFVRLCPGVFSPDGRTCVARGPAGPEIVSASDGKTLRKLHAVKAQDYGPAVFEPKKGRFVALAAEGKLLLLDPSSGGRAAAEDLGQSADLAAVSPGGEWLAWTPDSQVFELVSLVQGGKPRKLAGEAGFTFNSLAVDPRGKHLATVLAWTPGKRGGMPVLWQIEGGRLKRTTLLDAAGDGVDRLAFSPDGEWLALGLEVEESPVVRLFSLKARRLQPAIRLKKERAGFAGVQWFAFDPKSKLLATKVYGGTRIQLVDVAQVKVASEISLPGTNENYECALAFSPDGSTLAVTGNTAEVLLYDVAERRVKAKVTVEGMDPEEPVFSPDGRLLAIAARWMQLNSELSYLVLLDVASKKRLLTLPVHASMVTGLSFARDGKRVLTWGADGAVRAWGVLAGAPPLPPEGEPKNQKAKAGKKKDAGEAGKGAEGEGKGAEGEESGAPDPGE